MSDTPTIFEEFRQECRELLEGIEQVLRRMDCEQASPEDCSLLRRRFHSVKGGATFAGADGITRLTHEMEDLLDELEVGPMPPEILRALWTCHDAIHQALERPEDAPPSPEPTRRQPAPVPAPTWVELTTLRVGLDKLDLLVDLASELVLVRNQVNSVLRDPEIRLAQSPTLQRAVASMEQLNAITRDLQRAVMDTRMVRVRDLVRDVPRQVRGLAQRLGKQIDCQIEGEMIELDKTLIDRLRHPIGHLISNACDHGIELPAERLAAGKPATGTVRLAVLQEENFVRIVFEDDGAGIEPGAILAVALERGLVGAADAERLSRESVLSLIFEPGFSSSDQVTDTSGRGIGLDVVRHEVEAMNGSISLSTVPGSGTRFEMRLPLSLFVMHALNFRIGEQLFAIPLTNVVEVVRPEVDAHRGLDLGEHLVHGDEVYPLVHLDGFQADATPDPVTGSPSRRYYIMFSHLGRRAALPVDRIVGQEEIVVRNLAGRLERIPGCRGLSILGDGSVVPVLDIGSLLDPVTATTPA